ncbi:MAG: FG-GAP repeat protein [Anaerolineales bacterium]
MFHISRIKTAFTITLVLISLGSASIYIALAGAGAQIGAAPSSGMADTQGNTYLYLPIITRPFVSIGDDPDFNGDGFADLAIGAPGEELGGSRGAGAANVLYGSWSVLSATNDQFWYQGLNNVEGSSALGDHFAWAVAVGDFNSDGYDDLALGVPDENNRGTTEASGAVNVLYGQSSGISDTNDELWNQNTEGIQDGAEERDFYGKALAAGDFDGDGIDDLAVGVPEEDIDSKANAGAVNVIYGTSGGLDGAGDQLWTQTNTGDATSGTQDMFGSSVAVGDFDGDGFDDLAIGVPFKEVWTDPNTLITEAGAVHVLYGSSSSLTGNNSDYWHQAITNTLDTPETSDRYGSALTVGDFNADGYDDLAVGIPLEDIGGVLDAGAVHVLYGSASGLAVTSDQLWYQGLLANASDDTDD